MWLLCNALPTAGALYNVCNRSTIATLYNTLRSNSSNMESDSWCYDRATFWGSQTMPNSDWKKHCEWLILRPSYFFSNSVCLQFTLESGDHLPTTTLVVQVKQSVWCVCLSVCVCPDNNFWTKWPRYLACLFILTQVEFEDQGRSQVKVHCQRMKKCC